MGTVQHFVLFEHVSGYTLFRVKEFDEITGNYTAHANAFIKPIAFVHFKTIEEAAENVQYVCDGRVSSLLKQFLRLNVPHTDCLLGISDEKLGKAIQALNFGFDCVWHTGIREVLRIIRQNFVRLTRSLITQPGAANLLSSDHRTTKASTAAQELVPGRVAECRARLTVSLFRARLQLNLSQYLADSGVIRALSLLDDLDNHLTKSTSSLRASYNFHFPEVCKPQFATYLEDLNLIKLISQYPKRSELELASQTNHLNEWLPADIILTARNSIGTDLSDEDANNLKCFASRLLKLLDVRERHVSSLARRIDSLCPNLSALLSSTLQNPTSSTSGSGDLKQSNSISSCLVAARLIANAGSLNRLASMPATRVLSLGASKALFKKSGAVVATASGLLASKVSLPSNSELEATNSNKTTQLTGLTPAQLKFMSANQVNQDDVRKRAARLIAAKSTLACRADCFRYHNPVSLAKQPPESSDSKSQLVGDPRLESGLYGKQLGQTVHNQMRIWAETNGVHVERTEEKVKLQREKRKCYRKAKRKAWLLRKHAQNQITNPNSADTSKPIHVTHEIVSPTDPTPANIPTDLLDQSVIQIDSSEPESSVVSTENTSPTSSTKKRQSSTRRTSVRLKRMRMVSTNA